MIKSNCISERITLMDKKFLITKSDYNLGVNGEAGDFKDLGNRLVYVSDGHSALAAQSLMRG